jgi:non-homologous end joining protein Ku
MAPRSIWNGTITFGLVDVPVKLYTATESKGVSIHRVHVREGARIEHRRMCSKEDKVDLLHRGVNAVATGAAADALVPPATASSWSRGR